MTLIERLWPYLFFVAAVAMAVFTAFTSIRGWIKDEDGEIHHRSDGPRAFLFMQALQLASVVLLLFLGVKAFNGWN